MRCRQRHRGNGGGLTPRLIDLRGARGAQALPHRSAHPRASQRPMRRAPPRCRPGLLHPGGSAGHTERQAPYLSGSIGPARDRAHDENPPLPACEQRPRDAVQRGSAQGGPPASELTAPRAHSSRKALHVRPGEGGRRASCPARCRRAALNLSPGDGTSANSLGADMPRCRSHQ